MNKHVTPFIKGSRIIRDEEVQGAVIETLTLVFYGQPNSGFPDHVQRDVDFRPGIRGIAVLQGIEEVLDRVGMISEWRKNNVRGLSEERVDGDGKYKMGINE